jgi:hypothetical protein
VSISDASDAALEAASEDDRAWFEANPNRSFRARPQVPGEWPAGALSRLPHGQFWFTVINQVKPGVRMRLPISVEAEPDPDERAASVLFALATERGIQSDGLSE